MSDSTPHPDSDHSRRGHSPGHSRDGVRGHDNPAPRWWVVPLAAAIAAAALCVLYLHLGPGRRGADRDEADREELAEQRIADPLAPGDVTESLLAWAMADETVMASGERIFRSKCSPCHGRLAEGAVGPNLTDEHWIHGPQLIDVHRIVRDGVIEKGMLAWERQLRPSELIAVSSYVGGLLGSSPPNPKPPQGKPAERQPPDGAAAGADPAGALASAAAAATS
ncbi:MAG TPA: c-type cytochrome [Thermoanaerobaculales bacterium]|nr:c-type cytochrome [Thermoanaerobaculales bacterium]HPA81379.1 c-type cytochrome [Thermoanaerobaculales bacterium]HQL30101.1 c-type cytochrome [Thermoanaerobaculales bacterium]HQN94786.1 c-type cytochrome [Thermoanaerobaculales bacterium]HQP43999.1 c-type cytochrome [Thermoanaerobaculales bacterium]